MFCKDKEIIKKINLIYSFSKYKKYKELVNLMSSDYLNAYQSMAEEPIEISHTKISKVSYILKLKSQNNSISDLDRKHKALGGKNHIQNDFFNKT